MRALLRLEAAAVLRARWLVLSAVAAALGVLFFMALASRESSIVRFTGFGRVVTGLGTAGLLVLPLLGVLATAQSVTTARAQGGLEWLLSHPVSRAACFQAMVLPRFLAVLAPVLLALGLLGAAGVFTGEVVDGWLLFRLLGLLAGQAFCFTSLGFLVSVFSTSSEQALMRSLVVWLVAVALLDFALMGALLRWQLPAEGLFWLSALNPVQAGRLGLLTAIDPELGVLGPVGTYIATNLGPRATLAYGLGWPVVVAMAAIGLAWRRFSRGDLL